MKRRCLGPAPGVPCPTGGLGKRTRCEPCRLAWERTRRPSTSERGYGSGWQSFSRSRVGGEPWCHTSPACPYADSGTPANPLTTDHATFGLVICRRCNSSKQHADRARGAGRISRA